MVGLNSLTPMPPIPADAVRRLVFKIFLMGNNGRTDTQKR
jgi:hypothetical protein